MNDTTPDATAIFAPIWRRKWLILAVAILVGVGSYLYFKRERPTFQTSTEVFLGASAEEQALAGHATKQKSLLNGQATVVSAIVVEEVRRKLRAEHKGALVTKAKIHAKIPEKSEILQITVEGHTRKGTALLANLVAQTYIRRQETKRQRAIRKSIAISRRQLARIEAASAAREAQNAANAKSKKGGGSKGASASSVIQEANLTTKINEAESQLDTATAVQIKPAKPANATLLSPKPRKDAEFGFVIALVLACLAAILAGRLDKRVRSPEAMEALFGLPLLTVLPKVQRPVVKEGGSSRPSQQLLEPLRRLDTELMMAESVNGATAAQRRRVILVVSPDPGDGKSTIVADLALAQREAGKHVVVFEANFRRPVQAKLLSLQESAPLPELLSGRIAVDDALQRVLPPHAAEAYAAEASVGSLFALTADRSVSNPPALLSNPITGEVLANLAARFDYVLIDAPSPLEFSDAVSLFGVVDGILLVLRAGHTREASAHRLRQMLAGHASAPTLGVVANFVSRADLRRYGFATGSPGFFGGGQRRP
jgi:Mrp family chromosome partitioning ATPase/capsular polysaccharide biosynthesis protein